MRDIHTIAPSTGIQDSLAFWIPDSRQWIPDLCQCNLDSGFQSLAEFWIPRAVFRIPRPRVPDSSR